LFVLLALNYIIENSDTCLSSLDYTLFQVNAKANTKANTDATFSFGAKLINGFHIALKSLTEWCTENRLVSAYIRVLQNIIVFQKFPLFICFVH
jgi:hypothetical protein